MSNIGKVHIYDNRYTKFEKQKCNEWIFRCGTKDLGEDGAYGIFY